ASPRSVQPALTCQRAIRAQRPVSVPTHAHPGDRHPQYYPRRIPPPPPGVAPAGRQLPGQRQTAAEGHRGGAQGVAGAGSQRNEAAGGAPRPAQGTVRQLRLLRRPPGGVEGGQRPRRARCGAPSRRRRGGEGRGLDALTGAPQALAWLVIRVPTPSSVKISSNTAWLTRPSTIWALRTPPLTASRAQPILGSMPP